MINDTSSFEEVRAHIFKVWTVSSKPAQDMTEATVFMTGQSFIDFGTLALRDVCDFYKAGLIDFTEVEIEPYVDEFEVVTLSPSFRKACEHYKRPSDFPSRGEELDEYEHPKDFDSDDEDIDFEDYRRGGIYLMSEAKLRAELKSRDRKWLIYRTPYRPETHEELRRPL